MPVVRLAGPHIPQPDGLVGAAAGDGLPIGAEGHTEDYKGMPSQGVAELARAGRP